MTPVNERDVEAIALHQLNDEQNEEDEDEEDFDHDSVALLSPRSPRIRSSDQRPPKLEVWAQVKSLVTEAAPTLLLTTFSLAFTGELLDHVSRWRAMRELDQLILIIPVLLNLNGNIEMNLSARLGTAANVGELDDPVVRRSMITGNMALLQVQTISVAFVAGCVSLLLGIILPRHTAAVTKPPSSALPMDSERRTIPSLLFPRRIIPHPSGDGKHKTGLNTIVMVAGTAMSAASLSGLVLGSFMIALTVLCRNFGLDPDNIAPPIASCLGDLVTLFLLGIVSNILIPFLNTPIPFFVFVLAASAAVTCFYFTRRNPHVCPLLLQGWSPLLGAMIISCATGIVLDLFVSKYEGFALLYVVISGLPGAVGSIYISRLSTSLHAAALERPPLSPGVIRNGRNHLQTSVPECSFRLTMITLLLVTLPVEIIFIIILRTLGWLHVPFIFAAFSVFFFCCAVFVSLSIAHLLTNLLWKRGLDPDMYALPIHSALMDLVGQTMLILCFEIVSLLSGGKAIRTQGS
ncbi:Mg transporter [Amanita rubescens]|nr:Mg transporter [Amanita rubescens]